MERHEDAWSYLRVPWGAARVLQQPDVQMQAHGRIQKQCQLHRIQSCQEESKGFEEIVSHRYSASIVKAKVLKYPGWYKKKLLGTPWSNRWQQGCSTPMSVRSSEFYPPAGLLWFGATGHLKYLQAFAKVTHYLLHFLEKFSVRYSSSFRRVSPLTGTPSDLEFVSLSFPIPRGNFFVISSCVCRMCLWFQLKVRLDLAALNHERAKIVQLSIVTLHYLCDDWMDHELARSWL